MLLRRASKEAKPQLPRSCPHTFFVEPSPTSPLLLVVSNIAYIATALGGSSFAYDPGRWDVTPPVVMGDEARPGAEPVLDIFHGPQDQGAPGAPTWSLLCRMHANFTLCINYKGKQDFSVARMVTVWSDIARAAVQRPGDSKDCPVMVPRPHLICWIAGSFLTP